MKRLLFALVFLSACTAFAQQAAPAPAYPGLVGYVSVLHPIVTVDEDTTVYNFSNGYTVAFPMGINLLKSDRTGFSFEIAPVIKAKDGRDAVSSIVFHPGVMFRYAHGFTFVLRAAFETTGRYGLTPIFNQVVLRTKSVNYFAALSLPSRTGNEQPSSIGLAIQLGVSF